MSDTFKDLKDTEAVKKNRSWGKKLTVINSIK